MIAETPYALPADTRPMAWGYVRISNERQYQKENSIPFQKERVMAYYQFALAVKGIDFAEIVEDLKAVSAYATPFAHRGAGATLMRKMRPGDHLIIDKMDRIWRRALDYHLMARWFEERRITLHIVNLQGMVLDTSNPYGKLFFSLLAEIAEIESRTIGMRRRAYLETARKLGIATTSKPLPGTKHVAARDQKSARGKVRNYVVWDNDERAVMADILRRCDELGKSFEQVSVELETHLAAKHGRIFSRSAFYKRYWSQSRVRDAYWYEWFYRCHNICDVTQMPFNICVAIRKFSQYVEAQAKLTNNPVHWQARAQVLHEIWQRTEDAETSHHV